LSYRVNLIPDEYTGEAAASWIKLRVWHMFAVLAMAFFAIIYIYMSGVAADNQKEIEVYRQTGGISGAAAPGVEEIQNRRREYADRLKIVGSLFHRQLTTADITDTLIKSTPPGIVLEELEINYGGAGESSHIVERDEQTREEISNIQSARLAGMSPSLGPVGIYLSEVQKFPLLTDVLLEEAVWDNGCYRFIIKGVIVNP
jgi:hypothetical protein